MKKIFFLLLLFLALGTVCMNAQVTIGVLEKPAKGALLDIKTRNNLTGGVASDKGGLLLPRVALQALNSLQPFIAAETAADKLEHTGLEVYNVTENASFKPGIYYWNGSQWKTQNGPGTVIYLPSFNLEWVSNALTGTLGEAGDYDYVVTDYDTSCITINSISASGEMSYQCTATAPTASSHVNIILIKK